MIFRKMIIRVAVFYFRIESQQLDNLIAGNDNEIPDDDKGEMLYETPATLNDTWGYKSFDNHWKNAAEIRRIREHLNSRGINYLLNVGPDALGRIPAPAIDILKGAKV